MLLGVHCSIKGSLHNAFSEAASLGIDTFQIFTKNQRQWKERIIDPAEKRIFRERLQQSNIKTIFSHASYLVNLATNDRKIHTLTYNSLVGEIQRCDELGIAHVIIHPGSAKNASKQTGMKNVIGMLKSVIQRTKNSSVKILLENTAGQGSSVGSHFHQLRQFIDDIGSERIGICFDTCHAFAAGYDIRTKIGFETTMEEFDTIIGMNNLFAIHLNDSKGALGSKLDRHEHIGKGAIGIEPFKLIMNTMKHIPKILETPKEEHMDVTNLNVLRELIENNS
ncbi:MAG: deoxyribonuclease IV [Planctomycetes bacterium]|nr:deoxyribonuclease IV [Planctomycetota bacterium]